MVRVKYFVIAHWKLPGGQIFYFSGQNFLWRCIYVSFKWTVRW